MCVCARARVYGVVLHGEPESDAVGRTVLANQFVSGLRNDLKSKVVGTEGNFVKARFEEAKKRELAATKSSQEIFSVSSIRSC